MPYFVAAVVIVMLALIDMLTNLRLLVTRRLARRLVSTSDRVTERAKARQVAAELEEGVTSEQLLRALTVVRTQAA
jgi:hypothetical protein